MPAVVIGSVGLQESNVTTSQPGIRSDLGRAANRFIQWLVLPGISDTQRGFKVFSGEASDAIFRRCSSDGWAFDVEALAYARALGYHILEVPITWEHREDSRVQPYAYFTSMMDVVKIKRRIDREAQSQESVFSPTPLGQASDVGESPSDELFVAWAELGCHGWRYDFVGTKPHQVE